MISWDSFTVRSNSSSLICLERSNACPVKSEIKDSIAGFSLTALFDICGPFIFSFVSV